MSKRVATVATTAAAADEEGSGGKRPKPSDGEGLNEAPATATAGAGGKKLNKTDLKWLDAYHRLVAYKEEHGHTHVSLSDNNYIPGPCDNSKRGQTPLDRDRHSLAKWCSRQREAKKNGKLRADREKLLADIDFYFNSHDYVWDQHYDAIVSIMKKAGHDKVDISSCKAELKDESKRVYEGYMDWGKHQRLQYTLYQMNYKTTITERRIKKLDDIGFVWHHGERWEDNAKKTNHMWVTRNFKTYGAHKRLMDAIKRAKQESAATGEHALVMYDSYHLVGIEPDGTFFLLLPEMVEEIEKKGHRVACF